MEKREKRDTLDGDTVKRDNCTGGFGSGVLVKDCGGGESLTVEDVGRGWRVKSSSHSKPPPDRKTVRTGRCFRNLYSESEKVLTLLGDVSV